MTNFIAAINDFIANGPISMPIHIPDLDPDVDFNGMKFSYRQGVFFTPNSEQLPIKLPPPFSETA